MKSFQEFWPFYVRQHLHPLNRKIHFYGTLTSFLYFGMGWARGWPFFYLAPLLTYGPAFLGHFILEKNKPATFTYPLWSVRGDFKMVWLMLQGRMTGEVARLQATKI